jgi:preprotein translocase subunit SecF
MRSWPLIKILPTRTHFHFVRWARIMAMVSLVAVVASLASVAYPGLNRGIDFRGGTVLEFSTPTALDLGKVRSTLGALKLGDVQVQNFASKDDPQSQRHAAVSFQTPPGAEDASTVARVKSALNASLGQVTYSRAEVVGPKVSGELFRNGILALLVAIGLMLVYIWFRFELQFGIGAVAALFHDVILTFGLIVLLRIEFDLRLIAALLTVIGYSMNDTVVVFDRLRENLRKYKRMSLAEMIDLSINETLTRTIITGVTALLALAGLAIFGGEALRGFSIVLMFGIAIGTYSSIYIAAPVVLIWGRKQRLAEEPEVIKPQPARP